MFGSASVFRCSHFQPLGRQSLAFTAAALLLVPPVACQCADGSVRPFCSPGRCASSTDKACHGDKGYCATTQTGGCCQKKHPPTGPVASKSTCCKLIVQDSPPVTIPVMSDSPVSSICEAWLIAPATDLTATHWWHAPLATPPPPVDIVITQLRLTI
jgi:hypothetical protein